MTYKVTEEGDTSTVFLDGEIDMDKTEGAKEVIFPLIDAGKNVNLNLSNVQYMDSSGISVLIESHQKALEKGTKLIVKDVSKSVLKVIMMAKLEQILNFSKTSLEKLLTSFKLEDLTKKSFFSDKFVVSATSVLIISNYSKFKICSNFAIIITFKPDLLTSLTMSLVPFSNAF